MSLTHTTAFVLGSSPQLQIVDGAMVSFYVSLMLLRLFWEEARSYRSWIGPW